MKIIKRPANTIEKEEAHGGSVAGMIPKVAGRAGRRPDPDRGCNKYQVADNAWLQLTTDADSAIFPLPRKYSHSPL